MPVTSQMDQIFGESTENDTAEFDLIDSPSMLLSVLMDLCKAQWHNADLRGWMRHTWHDLDDQWQSLLKSSWAHRWLPEVQYLQGWTLGEVLLLLGIGILTVSWYTIRTDRKRSSKSSKSSSASNGGGVAAQLPHLPTLPIGNLGFSAGTSWERRYQSLAMWSCSLAILLPGTCVSWALVGHFGLVLPWHAVWNGTATSANDAAWDSPHHYGHGLAIGGLCFLVWLYLVWAFGVDDSPTSGNRTPWIRTAFPNWWNHACDFLPVVLVKTADLPAFVPKPKNGNSNSNDNDNTEEMEPARYVLGYHPHGIIAVGAFLAFATDGARILDLSGHSDTHNGNNSSNSNSSSNNGSRRNSSTNSSKCRRSSSSQIVSAGLPLRPSALSLLDDDDENDDDDASHGEIIDKLCPPAPKSPPARRGFSTLFPKLDRRIVTLPVNFATPFLREYLLGMGAVTSQKETFRSYLKNPNHNTATTTNTSDSPKAMVVVVGGAAESMLAHEGHIELVLQRRRGFVREAILANASLVPVLGFGETNLYTLYDELEDINLGTKETPIIYPTSPLAAVVSMFQNFARKSLGVAVPLFTGRSVFFKSLGVMPRRRPVVVVVGKPIPPPPRSGNNKSQFAPQIDRATDRPLNEDGRVLIEWHAKYVRALEALYHDYKDAPWNAPGNNRAQSMKIVR